MSKALILRSVISDELINFIDEVFLRPHCLQDLKKKAMYHYSNMLSELNKVITHAFNLCHPWEPIAWNWEDKDCVRYFANVCLHYKQDHL